uniref:UvrABC system protein A n=1 Tax=uncultured Armatimonadetes bacterium TaxID=157466 RepID=A0A6J4JTB8_9BACT|nr:Excinuclease ABC subunit A [uncultured Armatimonadetes bacterium]
MRDTIAVRGAKEHNLQHIDVEIPRDKLVVVTGLSGSGKSSLAFDTIYAEGQRRFFESLSAFQKKFAAQLKKPDVDFVFGLSPVISIEQKSVTKNPRSTVGTMTDLYDYLRLLYATAGVAHCPRCKEEVPVKTPAQIAERVLALPDGTLVELCAPVFKIYGEDYTYLLADIRTKGYRRVRIDDDLCDISDDLELDETRDYDLEVVIDRFVVKREIDKNLLAAVQNGLRVGEGFLRVRLLSTPGRKEVDEDAFFDGFACPDHHTTMGQPHPAYFGFNEGDGPCLTCSGLGTYLKVHPDLLVPDRTRSIKGGAFIPEAFKYDKNLWAGRLMYSLARHVGFSLDTPFCDLPPEAVDAVFYGTRGERFPLVLPEGAKSGDQHVGKLFRFDGIIHDIERRYKHYRKQQVAHTWMETYLRRVMVEHTCPDCRGRKLKPQRFLVTVGGRDIHAVGELSIQELCCFLQSAPLPARQRQAGEQIVREITTRLELLLGIGLDYLNLNRRAMTLSGGESQRIRLSTQISSGLMGMLYVLDEPSIGLHPKDNVKLIQTLKRLRDIGNTVIVVEHDEETIRAADHIVELGPGPGVHGGRVVAQGTLEEVLASPDSPTGQYLSGRKRIARPAHRRAPQHDRTLTVCGARHNNLKNITVEIPLGVFTCVTGASGSGKSTLINEILSKKLYSLFHDSRVLSGEHDALLGVEYLSDVVNIDQSPIGRSPRSNPATYIGVYDEIRRLFTELPESRARGYGPGRFSFNVKGGRCEECGGEGIVTTHLHFMPDVENPCGVCKGARYNEETLEVKLRGKTIADVLFMTIEEAERFFQGHALVAHKLHVLNDLGLGYLQLGQSSTTLSGGEAQRVKLAYELGKIKRGGRNLYILDEPTTGLHLADIQRLLDSLNRLVDAGNTVLVIEHHLDVIKTADHVIDLGPDGGKHGGEVIATGTPEDIVADPRSHTGRFLRGVLEA